MVLLLLSSCGMGQMDVGVHSDADGIWYGPSYGKHMSGTVYTVGLDYPDGYDWRTDADKGEVKCSLVMFADRIPVLKVPVGSRYEVSSDNARHRLRSGYLYTDYTDGNTTVIRRDGQELVRFDGAEEIVDLEVYDGSLHSLGCPKGGSGFVYRIDGEVAVERESGSLLSGLSVCDGKICFCFSRQTVSSSGALMNHYLSEDGKVSLVETGDDVEEVLDMGVYADGLYMLVRVRGVGAPVLIKGESRRIVSLTTFSVTAFHRLYRCHPPVITTRSTHIQAGQIKQIKTNNNNNNILILEYLFLHPMLVLAKSSTGNRNHF